MRTPAAHSALRLSMIVLGVLLATGVRAADDTPTSGAAGMRVYRDPATGAFVPPPPGTTALDTTTRDTTGHTLGGARRLVETPGTSPAGGVMIDLQGAFQSEITATVDADGHTHTECAEKDPTSR